MARSTDDTTTRRRLLVGFAGTALTLAGCSTTENPPNTATTESATPTASPTASPTTRETRTPTDSPTASDTSTRSPTDSPTESPTQTPTRPPTESPTEMPTAADRFDYEEAFVTPLVADLRDDVYEWPALFGAIRCRTPKPVRIEVRVNVLDENGDPLTLQARRDKSTTYIANGETWYFAVVFPDTSMDDITSWEGVINTHM